MSLRHSNEDAQAAIIFLLVAGLVACLLLYIYMGPVMDQFSIFHNDATQGPNAFMPLSQERQDSIFITQLFFQGWPIVAFVILIIAAIVAGLKWRSQAA